MSVLRTGQPNAARIAATSGLPPSQIVRNIRTTIHEYDEESNFLQPAACYLIETSLHGAIFSTLIFPAYPLLLTSLYLEQNQTIRSLADTQITDNARLHRPRNMTIMTTDTPGIQIQHDDAELNTRGKIRYARNRAECKISPLAAQIHSLAQAAGFRSVEKSMDSGSPPLGLKTLIPAFNRAHQLLHLAFQCFSTFPSCAVGTIRSNACTFITLQARPRNTSTFGLVLLCRANLASTLTFDNITISQKSTCLCRHRTHPGSSDTTSFPTPEFLIPQLGLPPPLALTRNKLPHNSNQLYQCDRRSCWLPRLYRQGASTLLNGVQRLVSRLGHQTRTLPFLLRISVTTSLLGCCRARSLGRGSESDIGAMYGSKVDMTAKRHDALDFTAFTVRDSSGKVRNQSVLSENLKMLPILVNPLGILLYCKFIRIERWYRPYSIQVLTFQYIGAIWAHHSRTTLRDSGTALLHDATYPPIHYLFFGEYNI
ncbi:hypothetical protein CCUS01_13333 [Colletotrichum cuscutae]|uniref:Uncharacterized protein n=1 Tax=Colletotrichum cuscutae TaxID=1209917 RepID=A0AAJ0DP73_9PEZI|nr:hypothetical protein CCUS01_13333 [Colletotrichum cuscutae]